MNKIFVTGGAGFIGSSVIRELIGLGHEVTLFDSFVNYVYPLNYSHIHNITKRMEGLHGKVKIIRGSTHDLDYLRRSLVEAQPSHVIHLAAMPLANLAIHHPEEALNSILNGTMNLLQIARDLKCIERFVYVSSSMVYGDFLKVPCNEDHITNPKEVYGALKLSGEVLTRAFGGLYNIDYSIVRPSAVYGPTDNNYRVLGIFLENALSGKPLVVKGAEQVLDFTYVSDTASGIIAATLHPNGSGKTFNITRGKGRTILEAAEIVAKLVPGTVIQTVVADKKMPSRGELDISRARELIGYQPKVDLEEGLAKYCDFLRSQRSDQKIVAFPEAA